MRRDIDAARGLRKRKFPSQTSRSPVRGNLLDRVNRAIDTLVDATNEASKRIEGVRAEKSLDQSLSVAKRFKWVYNEKKKKNGFIARQWILTAAHYGVLQVMTSMDFLPDVHEEVFLAPPPTYEETILRSPSQKRALKGKDTSIVVTEREKLGGTSKVATIFVKASC